MRWEATALVDNPESFISCNKAFIDLGKKYDEIELEILKLEEQLTVSTTSQNDTFTAIGDPMVRNKWQDLGGTSNSALKQTQIEGLAMTQRLQAMQELIDMLAAQAEAHQAEISGSQIDAIQAVYDAYGIIVNNFNAMVAAQNAFNGSMNNYAGPAIAYNNLIKTNLTNAGFTENSMLWDINLTNQVITNAYNRLFNGTNLMSTSLSGVQNSVNGLTGPLNSIQAVVFG